MKTRKCWELCAFISDYESKQNVAAVEQFLCGIGLMNHLKLLIE
jgi:hypothetical protein